jgi:hypothetical protein
MPNRLVIAYTLLGLLAVALLAFTVVVVRRRRAEHDLRWGNKKRWKRRED